MIRWTIGSGGFIGEVSLVPAEPEHAHLVRDGVPLYEVADLFVHPLRRGNGWAHKLMNKLVRECDRQRADCALRIAPHGLRPRPGTAQLQVFYGNFGFRPVPQFRHWPLMLRRIPRDARSR